MADPFVNLPVDQDDPCTHAAVVTPSDVDNLGTIPRCLLIGAAGAIKVTTRGGEAVTLQVQAGILPLRVSRVWSTGTTATGIVALW